MREFIPELIFHQDEPLSDWTAIPQHFVSRLARDTGTVVVQVGEGADELFHGYKGYVDHRRVVVPFQRWVPRIDAPPVGSVCRARQRARAGRGIRHGEALYDAGHSRIPYWGGALCFRGPLKERLMRRDHADALRTVERIWDEGGTQAHGRRSVSADDHTSSCASAYRSCFSRDWTGSRWRARSRGASRSSITSSSSS